MVSGAGILTGRSGSKGWRKDISDPKFPGKFHDFLLNNSCFFSGFQISYKFVRSLKLKNLNHSDDFNKAVYFPG
jgi:hypothetical protein